MYSAHFDPVKFERDCRVVQVPSGEELTMPAGTIGYLTQALGASFTVYVDGSLFRISGSDGDAIGREAATPPMLPDQASDDDVEKLIWHQLRQCYDPEIPVNIVDLGLVYGCKLSAADDGQRVVQISLTLTAPGCGMGETLVRDVRERVAEIPTVATVDVELTFDPPWSREMMSEEARLETGVY